MWKYRQRKKPKKKRKNNGKRVQMAKQIAHLITEKGIDTPRKLYLHVMIYQRQRKSITPKACIKFAQSELCLDEYELYELYSLCGYEAYDCTPQKLYKRYFTDVAQLVWYNTHNLDNDTIQSIYSTKETTLPNELLHSKCRERKGV